MTFPTLKRGDNGKEVKKLQTELNKVGAMLAPDGDFGPATRRGVLFAQDVAGHELTGIAKPLLWSWLLAAPKPYEKLHTNGVAFITREETGGLQYYDMVTRWPQLSRSFERYYHWCGV